MDEHGADLQQTRLDALSARLPPEGPLSSAASLLASSPSASLSASALSSILTASTLASLFGVSSSTLFSGDLSSSFTSTSTPSSGSLSSSLSLSSSSSSPASQSSALTTSPSLSSSSSTSPPSSTSSLPPSSRLPHSAPRSRSSSLLPLSVSVSSLFVDQPSNPSSIPLLESGHSVVKRKRGRQQGANSYDSESIDAALVIVESVLPINGMDWLKVSEEYNQWAKSHQRPSRAPDNLRKKIRKITSGKEGKRRLTENQKERAIRLRETLFAASTTFSEGNVSPPMSPTSSEGEEKSTFVPSLASSLLNTAGVFNTPECVKKEKEKEGGHSKSHSSSSSSGSSGSSSSGSGSGSSREPSSKHLRSLLPRPSASGGGGGGGGGGGSPEASNISPTSTSTTSSSSSSTSSSSFSSPSVPTFHLNPPIPALAQEAVLSQALTKLGELLVKKENDREEEARKQRYDATDRRIDGIERRLESIQHQINTLNHMLFQMISRFQLPFLPS